jgi:RHS repeat-associated protein
VTGRVIGRASLLVSLSAVLILAAGLQGDSASAVPGSGISYVYDELDRLVAVIDPESETAKYEYDAVGNILSISRQSSSTVSILEFSPNGAAVGTSVSVFGTGFSATPSENTLRFNGTVASVTSATATKLVATVPSGATSGAISVTTPSGSATSSGSFSVEAAKEPTIGSVTPSIGAAGSAVTITGTHFEPGLFANNVGLNGMRASLDSATATSIAARVPPGTGSGRITVSTAFGKATSTTDFFVPPSPFAAGDVQYTGRVATGESRTVSITTANKVGLVVFDGTQDQKISLTATNVTIGGSPCCGARVRIYNPDGTVLVPDTFIGTAVGFIDATVLPDTGTYTILVDPEATNTGNATLTLYDVQDVTSQISAGGSPVTVSTATPGQNAKVTFSGSADQRVSLKLTGVTIGTNPCCSAKASIRKPDGSTLVVPTYFGTAGGFLDTATLPTSGTYTILIDPESASTGSATLTLYDVPADVSGAITPGGASVTSTIGTPGQNAAYTFSGTANQRVSLKLTNSSIVSGTARFLKPDGSTLASTGFTSNGGGFLDTQTLPTAGTYTVQVDPAGANTGSVTLTLYNVPADVTGTITAGGSAVTSTIGTPGQNARYTFSGTANQRVSLKLTNSTIANGAARILKPDGSTLGSTTFAGGSGFLDTLALPTAGTYTVEVDPTGANTGSVTLTLYNVPADLTGTITAGGSAVTSTIGTPGQNARYTFTGTANQRVSLKLTNSTFALGTARLLKPDGSTLASTSFATGSAFLDTQTLLTAGTYTVEIDPTGANTGSVTLTLYNVPADVTGTITAGGSAVTGTIGTPGQNGAYTFGGAVNQRVSLKLSNVTIGSSQCCSARISILKPDGSTLVAPMLVGTNGGFIDTTTLPVAGSYTIVVDPQGADTGSITLTLYDVPADVTGSLSIGSGSLTITMSIPGQNGRPTFAGTTGQNIRLTMSSVTIGTSSCCSTKVSILKPDGSTLVPPTFVGTSGGTINTTLTATGSHTIVVDPQAADTGSITLALTLNGGGSPMGAPFSSANAWAASGGDTATRSHPEHRAHSQPAKPAQLQVPSAVAQFRPPLSVGWQPTKEDREQHWFTNRPASPWASLLPLRAERGQTALAGRALGLDGLPLQGVSLTIEGRTTHSDATGRFLLRLPSTGQHTRAGHHMHAGHNTLERHHVLEIDAQRAGHPRADHGFFEVGVAITAGRTNVLPFTIWLPKIDTEHTVPISSPTKDEVVATTPAIPGLEVHIAPGVTVTDHGGRPVRKIGITAIPVDRPPFPLPKDVQVPIYFTVQPGGAHLSGAGARIIYPNYRHLPPGRRVKFLHYRPKHTLREHKFGGAGWYVYGRGTVTPDGKQVVPDRGVAIHEFTGAMINDPNQPNPPGTGPKDGGGSQDGDPVDLGTGLFVLNKTDLALEDPLMPLSVTRVYRPIDSASRQFGIGTQLAAYDVYLRSLQQYQEADLVLPDGGQIHYVRISPGTGNTDAVFEHTATPGAFYKSLITWRNGGPDGNGWDLKLKDGTVFVFGDSAPLNTIRDRNGNEIKIERDSVNVLGQPYGNATQVTSPTGRWLKFTYDLEDRITRAEDNTGRAVIYDYDEDGRLWKVTDPDGGVTEYTYDAEDRMETIRDRRGILFLTNEYDTNGRVWRQTQADSSTYEFAYTLDGDDVTQTDVTDPRDHFRRVTFNADGFPTSETEALGTSLEQESTYERQAGTGRLLSKTDALGRRTEYGYDALGNVTSVTELAGTPDAITSSTSYDSTYSQPLTITDPLNHTTSFGYDAKGNLTSVTDPLGKRTTIAYTRRGLPRWAVDPLEHTTTLGYELGDLASVTDPLGRTTKRFVDAGGRVTAETDAVGNQTRIEHDLLNRVTSVVDPAGGETSFDHDMNGNLLSVTDARDKITSYMYDSMDRLETRTDPLLRQESYEYDEAGNLAEATDRRGKVTTYEYDALDRVTFAGFGTVVEGGNTSYESTIDYGYDAGNRLTSAADSETGTIARTYDDLDRLTLETTPQGAVTYAYDDAGRRTSMTVDGQPTVTYDYDGEDQLTEVAQGFSTVGLAYDDLGRRTSLTLPNGTSTSSDYDDASQVTGLTYRVGQTVLGDLAYNYDASGRRTAIGGSYARTSLPQAVGSASYDDANELTQWGSASLGYDANGNLTSQGSTSYDWNARNQLSSLTGGSGLAATFDYDGLGRRVGKTVNGQTTQFLYDGRNPVQELSASGSVTANLLTGLAIDEVFGRAESGTSRNLFSDALHSTLALTDAAGAVQTQYSYEPFGMATTTGSANSNSFQFTGRESDGQTGLNYYRARYYSPGLQRFISEDPLGFASGDADLYAYVGNAPMDYVDPSGLTRGSRQGGPCSDGGWPPCPTGQRKDPSEDDPWPPNYQCGSLNCGVAWTPFDFVDEPFEYLEEHRWARCALFAAGTVGLVGSYGLAVREARAAARAGKGIGEVMHDVAFGKSSKVGTAGGLAIIGSELTGGCIR